MTRLDRQLVQSGNDFTDFGDELDQQYEQELRDAENEGLIEGTPSTSDGVKDGNQNEKDAIKGYQEQIGFNVDNIVKGDKQERQEETKDPIENIKPRKTSTENVEVEEPKIDVDKILDDEIKKSNVDPKGEFDKQASNQINNLNIKPTDTGNDEINEFNKRRNELILQRKYGGTGRPITVGDETFNPGDKGYTEAINMIQSVTKKSGAIVPIKRE